MSTNVVARMSARPASRLVDLVLSTSAGFGLMRRQLSGAASLLALHPLEHHRLAAARELDALGVERAELEDVLAAVVVGALLQSSTSALSTVKTTGFDRSRA